MAVAGGLGWLLFGFAGGPPDEVLLLKPATPGQSRAAQAAIQSVHWLKDRDARATFEEVRGFPSDRWQLPTGKNAVWSYQGGAIWLRITFQNPGDRPIAGIIAAGDNFIDQVGCWTSVSGGDVALAEKHQWHYERTGISLRGSERTRMGRELAFLINVPAGGSAEAYLCFENQSVLVVRPEWWADEEAFHGLQGRRLLSEGVYFGGLLALLGYNLVLWARLRFNDIRWYILYLGGVLTFMALARAQPSALGWAWPLSWVQTLVAGSAAVSGVFLIQFARTFLDLKTLVPGGDRWARWLVCVLAALVVGAGTIPWTSYDGWMSVIAVGIVIAHALLLGLAIQAWRAGAAQARFFVLSFGCLFVGMLPIVAFWFGVNYLQDAGMKGLMLGSALEMLLLSLAVANRFAQTQQRLAEETEQRRAMQEAYASELEDEVRQRTRELADANTDKDRMLIALGHDLRSPLAALAKRAEQLRQREVSVESAEALRGFAGETAGESRQMLLLIEDIVLWARLRTGSRPLMNVLSTNNVVTPVVALHQPLAMRRGVALVTNVPENLMIRSDLVLAQTMVRNLVGNAVKFARARVEISARLVDDDVMIAVKDDGPGLPAGVRARLRGETGDDGGGMGLRLVQEIGEALGATLEAVTVESGGTEMRVTLLAALPAREGEIS
ncbi:sensor histidine kinase [Oleiharenicola lentus]|uniref:sensor histidine kinase n=1 Tax=Oleiharenicola lentus TaxID=2508720 RepID=UPI003F669A32